MFSKGWSQKVQSSYDQKDKDSGSYNNSEWVEKQKLRIDNLASELEVSKKRNHIIIDIVRKTRKDNKVTKLKARFNTNLSKIKE
jgi:hypothetical protein